MNEKLKSTISKFAGITLSEMDSVALLKRTDTKFVLPSKILPEILEKVKDEYRLLEIKGERLMQYQSLYFDTNNRKFYTEHHNGKIKRTKIRIRKYVSSNLHFLEVKLKDGKGNTNKTRLPINEFQENLDEVSSAFIKEVTGINYDLNPSLWNSFSRMTLVSLERNERATVDVNLAYSFDSQSKSIDDLAIIELKQVRYNRNSPIAKALKEYSIIPYGFSKYCIGMTQLHSELKHNGFKPKLLKIKKLTA